MVPGRRLQEHCTSAPTRLGSQLARSCRDGSSPGNQPTPLVEVGDVPCGGGDFGGVVGVVDAGEPSCVVKMSTDQRTQRKTHARWLLTSLPSSSCSGN